jgi:hypothetical protein
MSAGDLLSPSETVVICAALVIGIMLLTAAALFRGSR